MLAPHGGTTCAEKHTWGALGVSSGGHRGGGGGGGQEGKEGQGGAITNHAILVPHFGNY